MDTSWQDKVNFGKQYADHSQERFTTLSQFQLLCNGGLGQVNMGRQRIKHTSQHLRPINSATSWAVPEIRKLEKTWIDVMIRMNVVEPAQTKWTSQILFATRKDVSLCFCINYRKLNPLAIKDVYYIPGMDKYLGSLRKSHIF